MRQRSAEILCIGTEILMGDIVNTNAAYIAKELAGLGINVYHQSVVGDNPQRLREALELAFSRADIVITTGGLGPTYDDLSKETIAAFFGRELVMDQESLHRIVPLPAPEPPDDRKQQKAGDDAAGLHHLPEQQRHSSRLRHRGHRRAAGQDRHHAARPAAGDEADV